MRISKKITTAAAALALAAGLLAPTAAAACPYTVGPLGRYIAPAIVKGMTATDENQIEVWCSDALDGDDWYFLVDAETDLRIFDRVPLAPDPPARVPLAPFQGGTVSPPDDPAKCRRAKGSDSSLNGISPHR